MVAPGADSLARRRGRRWPPFLTALLALPAIARAQVEDARRLAETILDSGGFQRDLPVPPPAEPEPPPADWSFDFGPIPDVVLWGLAGAIILFLVIRLVRNPPALGRRRQAASAEAAAPGPAATPAAGTLAEADRLAGAGTYEAAIHALLLRCLDDLRRLLGRPVAESLTSREVVARVALPEAARGALSAIVGAVEISRFGGRPLGEADYRAARASYGRFAEAVAAGAG